MTRNFTDYHCHLIPAIDDGSTDIPESLRMARILADFGFTVVHCTPHMITGCYENDPARVTQETKAMQLLLDDAGIPLQLIPSTEHYMDGHLLDQLPRALTTGPRRHLLVETPFSSGAEMLPAMVAGLLERGLTPILAHPERCSVFYPQGEDEGFLASFSQVLGRSKTPGLEEDALVLRMRAAGCRFQGNLGSFAGSYGKEVKQRALLFLEHGVYGCLGSDAHRSGSLAKMLDDGLQAVVETVGEEAAFRLLSGSLLEE
jgi:protein-tyrosine phosphatase